MTLKVKYFDRGREPQCPPNPAYPHGVDIDLSDGASRTCEAAFKYPAPRCGLWIIECTACGLRVGVTTAGRADDPRSVKVACKGIADDL